MAAVPSDAPDAWGPDINPIEAASPQNQTGGTKLDVVVDEGLIETQGAVRMRGALAGEVRRSAGAVRA